MTNDPASLMLYTVVKSLQELGYLFKVILSDMLLFLFLVIMLFVISINLVIVPFDFFYIQLYLKEVRRSEFTLFWIGFAVFPYSSFGYTQVICNGNKCVILF